jgi:hypothetical protein
MYGKNCDVRVGTLQYLQPAGSYVSGGYLNYDTTAPINGNVNFESTSNTKWFFKEDGTGSLRNFDWMANPSYPAIGINPSNWYGGRSDDTSFNSTCLAVGDETSCMKTTDLYTTTGKIPDSDGNWKVNSFNSSQCNGGICYPTLIGSIQDNSIVTAWAGPRWPSGNNDYEYDWVPGSKITWVDLPLSEAEKQRAMQL